MRVVCACAYYARAVMSCIASPNPKPETALALALALTLARTHPNPPEPTLTLTLTTLTLAPALAPALALALALALDLALALTLILTLALALTLARTLTNLDELHRGVVDVHELELHLPGSQVQGKPAGRTVAVRSGAPTSRQYVTCVVACGAAMPVLLTY